MTAAARRVRGHEGLAASERGAVVALGNFDGVHAGHQAVIAQAGALAQRLDAPLGVALFDPHPRRFFKPDAEPFRLMAPARRDAVLGAIGVDRVHELAFNKAMASMTPEAFVEDVLHAGLGVKGVVTGADFRFGAKRAGGFEDLQRLGAARGIAVEAARLVESGQGGKLSSSSLRDLIASGDVAAAARIMGRPWTLDGVVEQGDQRGRTIGFPTANVALGDFLRPARGVYAVRVGIDGEGETRPGVANYGVRPTVDGLAEKLEVHLFDFDGDLYGKTLGVAFIDFIRPEQKFDGLEALKAQIAADAETARGVLG